MVSVIKKASKTEVHYYFFFTFSFVHRHVFKRGQPMPRTLRPAFYAPHLWPAFSSRTLWPAARAPHFSQFAIFMTKFSRKNVPDAGIELGTGCIPSSIATAPGS